MLTTDLLIIRDLSYIALMFLGLWKLISLAVLGILTRPEEDDE